MLEAIKQILGTVYVIPELENISSLISILVPQTRLREERKIETEF